MNYCFLPVASEVLRLMPAGLTVPPVVSLTMQPADTGQSRARAELRYTVTMAVNWGPVPWSGGVLLIDSRGYPLVFTFAGVGKWLAKSMSGLPCVVDFTITDASRLPVKWSQARASAAALKVTGLTVASVIAEADAKAASVAAWVISPRRTNVIAAADAMKNAATLLEQVQAVEAGGSLGGGGGGGAVNPWPADFSTDASVSVGGGVLYGEFVDGTKDQWVRFEAEPGKSYQIYLGGASTNEGTLQLPGINSVIDFDGIDIPGSFAGSVDSYGYFTVVVSPNPQGSYFIRVCSNDSSAGTFTVQLSEYFGEF